MTLPIYLDHNATTAIAPEVLEAMMPYLSTHFGNPSSQHAFGVEARRGIERAREQVATAIGAAPTDILFTTGGTEANNIAICGTVRGEGLRTIVTSTVEHPATTAACSAEEDRGIRVARMGVDAAGHVNAEHLRSIALGAPVLVSIMHANNEIGSIQPIEAIGRIARSSGPSRVHVDAAQSLGKIPVHVDDLGVDLLSIAGHKIYGPKGVGALYVRASTRIKSVRFGGGQERGISPGTENVAGIVGLGAACARIETVLAKQRDIEVLRERLFERLAARVPGLCRNSPRDRCLPNTLNVSFPAVIGRDLLDRTPSVAATTAAACHDDSGEPSHVLAAIGLSRDRARGAVRLSLGTTTTEEEVDRAVEALAESFAATHAATR